MLRESLLVNSFGRMLENGICGTCAMHDLEVSIEINSGGYPEICLREEARLSRFVSALEARNLADDILRDPDCGVEEMSVVRRLVAAADDLDRWFESPYFIESSIYYT